MQGVVWFRWKEIVLRFHNYFEIVISQSLRDCEIEIEIENNNVWRVSFHFFLFLAFFPIWNTVEFPYVWRVSIFSNKILDLEIPIRHLISNIIVISKSLRDWKWKYHNVILPPSCYLYWKNIKDLEINIFLFLFMNCFIKFEFSSNGNDRNW